MLPTAYRPRELARCLQSLMNTIGQHVAVIMASPIEDDPASIQALTGIASVTRSRSEYQRGAVYGWNFCLKAVQDAAIYVLAADDLVFYPNWLERALNELDRMGGGLVGFNDLSSDGNVYAAHWLASREFLIEWLGGVMYPPLYQSWWCDREVTDIAKKAGRYRWAKEAGVEHFNYTFGKSKIDPTYAEAQKNYEADRELYQERKRLGFPKTWEPILR